MTKQLTKSSDRMLAGICGGVADYFEVDPTLVRVCYATLTAFTGGVAGIVLYGVLFVIIPQGDDHILPPSK